jgi:hypothetical protein
MLSVFSKIEMNQEVKGDWNELLPLREANAILQVLFSSFILLAS